MKTRRTPGSGPSRTGAVCLLLLATTLAPVATEAEDAPATQALQARVNDAIDAGVAWLRAQQGEDGSFPLAPRTEHGLPLGDASTMWAGGPWDKGLAALSVYTLAVCGVEGEDPALERGFAYLRRLWAERTPAGDRLRPGSTDDGISTYFVSLCLLALDAAHNRGAVPLSKGPPDRKRAGRKLLGKVDFAFAEELVAWLEAAQDPGRDGDASRRPKRGRRRRAPSSKRAPSPADGGGFGYGSPADAAGYHDHSNSQFAVLGLKSAARLGVQVSDVAFLRALRHFLAVQEAEGPAVDRVDAPDAADEKAGRAPGETRTTDESTPAQDVARGWGYMCPNSTRTESPGGAPGGLPPGLPPGTIPGLPEGATLEGGEGIMGDATASMTAGGVSTLVICRSELAGVRGFTKALRQLTVKGIRDGLAWLAVYLEEEGEREAELPPARLPGGLEIGGLLDDFYFLYGLERACILGGVGAVGGIAWYDVGARRIVDRQRADGAFHSRSQSNGNGRPEIDTCFALLFLKRAVFRVPDRRVITPGD